MWDILIQLVAVIAKIASAQELDSDTMISAINEFILPPSDDLLAEIRQEIMKLSQVRDRTQYVTDLQAMLTRVVDDIILKFPEREAYGSIQASLDKIIDRSFLLLKHLFENYKPYFNLESPLPLEWFARMTEWARPDLSATLNDRLSGADIDRELIDLLQVFLVMPGDDPQPKIRTWGQLDYINYFKNQLNYFIARLPSENANLELLKLLVVEDFNSIHIYAYIVRHFEKITLSMSTMNEQQQELLYLQKVIRQLRVDGKYSFDANVQPLKITLINGLIAELEYLSQKEKLTTDDVKPGDSPKPSKFYFEVATTLAELMFFFRVLLDVGAIHTKFNAQLYDFIANHIRTQRAENLSKKSMRNHMSNKPYPDRIVQNTRDWLTKMISHIDMFYRD